MSKIRFKKVDVTSEAVDKLTKIFSNFSHIMKIADHYNIYKDLFGQGFFRPYLDLNVQYMDQNKIQKVFHGNKLSASLVC